ncbi:MAG: microtubule-binding protein [Bdellovibrionales bacterium]
MAFNYQKHKDHGGNESFWTSYSDLFLGLSTIFLLLYVTASLRTGTDGIKNQIENQKLNMQVQDLQNQLRMYESIKKDYLQTQAPKSEMDEYQELMDKLSLLQEEAKDEKERLRNTAIQNEMKEKALNKYQQMIRNVINANKVAKTKITNRDDIIVDQDEEIETQDQQITELEQEAHQKQKKIEEGERKIAETNKALDKKLAELKKAYKRNKMSAKSYEKKMAQLKEESENKVDALRDANENYQKQLSDTQNRISSLSGQLQSTQGQLAQKESEARDLQSKISNLKGEYAAQAAKERAAFDAELKRERVGAAERGRREAAFRAAAAAKERELAEKVAGLSGQVEGLSGKVAGLSGQLKSTEGQLRDKESQLAVARAEMDARRAVAREIKKGFDAAGVKADIDMQTGEVLIDFGQAYFDNDSAALKQAMKDVLEKAVPAYSKSLFGNPKVAEKISSVEVVGFASPTYKGRYVNPNSNKPEDKEAIKYNMDLSYRRAKSIFNHILDEREMTFEHQKELLPMMKVSGRSFLEVIKNSRGVASKADFCKLNDCKRAQRVIIRFSMDGKK